LLLEAAGEENGALVLPALKFVAFCAGFTEIHPHREPQLLADQGLGSTDTVIF
jgi:hypothetical protein